MDIVLGLLLTLAIPFAIIFGIIYLLRRMRAKAMKAVAQTTGFSFLGEGDDAFVSNLSDFKLFSKGYAKKIKDILKGEKGDCRVSIFNYSYRDTMVGANVSWDKATVISFNSDKLSVPNFSLRPKEFIEVEKSNAIKIDSNKVFSKRYVLQGSDENAVRNLFSLDILSILEQQKNWYVEGKGNKLIFYQNKYLNPKGLQEYLDKSYRIVTMLASS